jgi:hypothetical protein
MAETQTHNTYLAETYPSGAQRWDCLTCGHSVVWQGLPLKIKNIVLIEGNPNIYHVCNGGNEVLQFEVDTISPEEKELFDRWGDEFES